MTKLALAYFLHQKEYMEQEEQRQKIFNTTTLMNYILKRNLYEALQKLKEQGIITTYILLKKDNIGITWLFEAIRQQKMEIFKYILTFYEANKVPENAIFLACKMGLKKAIIEMKNKGVSFKRQNREGKTPIMVACQHQHEEIIKELLNESEFNVRDTQQRTLLHVAIETNMINLVKEILLKNEELINEIPIEEKPQLKTWKSCPLNARVDELRQLKEKKSKRCYQKQAVYPLVLAIRKGYTEIIKMLLPKSNEQVRGCAVEVAIEQQNWKVAKTLIESCTKLNIALTRNPITNFRNQYQVQLTQFEPTKALKQLHEAHGVSLLALLLKKMNLEDAYQAMNCLILIRWEKAIPLLFDLTPEMDHLISVAHMALYTNRLDFLKQLFETNVSLPEAFFSTLTFDHVLPHDQEGSYSNILNYILTHEKHSCILFQPFLKNHTRSDKEELFQLIYHWAKRTNHTVELYEEVAKANYIQGIVYIVNDNPVMPENFDEKDMNRFVNTLGQNDHHSELRKLLEANQERYQYSKFTCDRLSILSFYTILSYDRPQSISLERFERDGRYESKEIQLAKSQLYQLSLNFRGKYILFETIEKGIYEATLFLLNSNCFDKEEIYDMQSLRVFEHNHEVLQSIEVSLLDIAILNLNWKIATLLIQHQVDSACETGYSIICSLMHKQRSLARYLMSKQQQINYTNEYAFQYKMKKNQMDYTFFSSKLKTNSVIAAACFLGDKEFIMESLKYRELFHDAAMTVLSPVQLTETYYEKLSKTNGKIGLIGLLLHTKEDFQKRSSNALYLLNYMKKNELSVHIRSALYFALKNGYKKVTKPLLALVDESLEEFWRDDENGQELVDLLCKFAQLSEDLDSFAFFIKRVTKEFVVQNFNTLFASPNEAISINFMCERYTDFVFNRKTIAWQQSPILRALSTILKSKIYYKYTPLHWAVIINSTDMVDKCLPFIDINITINETSPMGMAIQKNNTHMVQYLLKKGADIRVGTRKSIFYNFDAYKNIDLLSTLIAINPDFMVTIDDRHQNEKPGTPLLFHLAEEKYYNFIYKWLLQQGELSMFQSSQDTSLMELLLCGLPHGGARNAQDQNNQSFIQLIFDIYMDLDDQKNDIQLFDSTSILVLMGKKSMWELSKKWWQHAIIDREQLKAFVHLAIQKNQHDLVIQMVKNDPALISSESLLKASKVHFDLMVLFINHCPSVDIIEQIIFTSGQVLIAEHARKQNKFSYDTTPSMDCIDIALRKGHFDLLSQYDSKVLFKTYLNHQASLIRQLGSALRYVNHNFIIHLLNKLPQLVMMHNPQQETLFHYACIHDHEKVVCFYLKRYLGDCMDMCQEKSQTYVTPFQLCQYMGSFKSAKQIASRLKQDIPKSVQKYGFCKMLVNLPVQSESKALSATRPTHHRTTTSPFLYACQYHNPKVAEYLYNTYSHLLSNEEKRLAIEIACQHCSFDILQLFQSSFDDIEDTIILKLAMRCLESGNEACSVLLFNNLLRRQIFHNLEVNMNFKKLTFRQYQISNEHSKSMELSQLLQLYLITCLFAMCKYKINDLMFRIFFDTTIKFIPSIYYDCAIICSGFGNWEGYSKLYDTIVNKLKSDPPHLIVASEKCGYAYDQQVRLDQHISIFKDTGIDSDTTNDVEIWKKVIAPFNTLTHQDRLSPYNVLQTLPYDSDNNIEWMKKNINGASSLYFSTKQREVAYLCTSSNPLYWTAYFLDHVKDFINRLPKEMTFVSIHVEEIKFESTMEQSNSRFTFYIAIKYDELDITPLLSKKKLLNRLVIDDQQILCVSNNLTEELKGTLESDEQFQSLVKMINCSKLILTEDGTCKGIINKKQELIMIPKDFACSEIKRLYIEQHTLTMNDSILEKIKENLINLPSCTFDIAINSVPSIFFYSKLSITNTLIEEILKKKTSYENVYTIEIHIKSGLMSSHFSITPSTTDNGLVLSIEIYLSEKGEPNFLLSSDFLENFKFQFSDAIKKGLKKHFKLFFLKQMAINFQCASLSLHPSYLESVLQHSRHLAAMIRLFNLVAKMYESAKPSLISDDDEERIKKMDIELDPPMFPPSKMTSTTLFRLLFAKLFPMSLENCALPKFQYDVKLFNSNIVLGKKHKMTIKVPVHKLKRHMDHHLQHLRYEILDKDVVLESKDMDTTEEVFPIELLMDTIGTYTLKFYYKDFVFESVKLDVGVIYSLSTPQANGEVHLLIKQNHSLRSEFKCKTAAGIYMTLPHLIDKKKVIIGIPEAPCETFSSFTLEAYIEESLVQQFEVQFNHVMTNQQRTSWIGRIMESRGVVSLRVDRYALFDSVIKELDADNKRFGEWRIVFLSERGIDQGGLLREFMTLFFNSLKDFMFQEKIASIDKPYFDLLVNQDIPLDYYRRVGMVCARGLLQYSLPVHLSYGLILALLNKLPSSKDMKFIDSSIAKVLFQESTENIEDWGMHFVDEIPYIYNKQQQYQTIELGDNGSSKPVTSDNFKEYTENLLKLRYGYQHAFLKPYLDAFCDGFW
eukprot:CAMPEP_0117433714 /NCGR_PEP_ID=MMETSP0758-20121206/13019_1 /TAXON_ID=63605 /ORGANISM="Percolomonas cosmopolitus, Strain AE-1 (ATCC 50343)" /LENGTH=2494 /DNA_ID=CAMNT_0005224541 /DNA_START=1132 /DNA_END=8613 /DNA_ORIENTATION=+